jgi:hypothetical protein
MSAILLSTEEGRESAWVWVGEEREERAGHGDGEVRDNEVRNNEVRDGQVRWEQMKVGWGIWVRYMGEVYVGVVYVVVDVVMVYVGEVYMGEVMGGRQWGQVRSGGRLGDHEVRDDMMRWGEVGDSDVRWGEAGGEVGDDEVGDDEVGDSEVDDSEVRWLVRWEMMGWGGRTVKTRQRGDGARHDEMVGSGQMGQWSQRQRCQDTEVMR